MNLACQCPCPSALGYSSFRTQRTIPQLRRMQPYVRPIIKACHSKRDPNLSKPECIPQKRLSHRSSRRQMSCILQ